MGRARKTAKPKQPAYQKITRENDQWETYPVLDSLLESHRKDLKSESCRIAIAWRYGWKKNKDGQLVLGKCKKISELDKEFQTFDFVIILNHEAWKELDENQRQALMFHELNHIAVSEDQNGNTKKDARNRTMFRIRKHDIEEFGAVIEHFGCYKQDLANFVTIALRGKVPFTPALPGLEPSANGAAHKGPDTLPMPAAARKRPAAKPARRGRGK